MLNGDHFYLVEPALGFMVVATLMLLSRWAAGPGRRPVADRPPTQDDEDYGLLVPIATVSSRADAESLRRLLTEHAIRGTVSAATGRADQRLQVLVFRHQALAARDLLLPRG